ncbi:MAG: DUF2486 family protein [Deltaproteobacteria bacterium]|nr:DUF2486 family protein [Deltaproteobacteria bacterium]
MDPDGDGGASAPHAGRRLAHYLAWLPRHRPVPRVPAVHLPGPEGLEGPLLDDDPGLPPRVEDHHASGTSIQERASHSSHQQHRLPLLGSQDRAHPPRDWRVHGALELLRQPALRSPRVAWQLHAVRFRRALLRRHQGHPVP